MKLIRFIAALFLAGSAMAQDGTGPAIRNNNGRGTNTTIINGTFSGNGSLVTNQTFAFQIIVDGGGSAVTTGTKAPVRLPRAGVITGAFLYADQNGSCGVDLWKTNYPAYVSTAATTVTGFAYPAMNNTNHMLDTTLTGWITNFSAGDVFTMNVVSNATCTRLILQITYKSL